MAPRDIFLALLVVIVWGVNFAIMKIGLEVLPPFLFSLLRFTCSALPLVFLVRRPAVAWRLLWGYALAQFVVQYMLLFTGLQLGMPAGLASLVIQLQAFFTIALAIPLLHERPRAAQAVGAAVAFAGMALVASRIEARTTLVGLVLVIGAGLAWGVGNIMTKRISLAAQRDRVKVDAMQIVAWGSLLSLPPLLAVSLIAEGPTVIATALGRIDWRIAGAVLFNGYVTTTFGFGVWSMLLRRYPTATVAPFTLLVPVAGMGGAAVLLGEAIPWWTLAAGVLVLAGLAINQFTGFKRRSK